MYNCMASACSRGSEWCEVCASAWLQCAGGGLSREEHLQYEMHVQGRWQSGINMCINNCLDNSVRHKASHRVT